MWYLIEDELEIETFFKIIKPSYAIYSISYSLLKNVFNLYQSHSDTA